MLSLLAVAAFASSTLAQTFATTPAVVCFAGQCLEGYSNTTIGSVLAAPGAPTSILLLPGAYESSTNPELLHTLLTSSSATLVASPGFGNATSSVSLPLNVQLQPGLAVYADALYSGKANYAAIPSAPVGANASQAVSANSIAIASGTWAAVKVGSSNTNRVVLWNSIPDVSQLPSSASGRLSLVDIQSSSCSPPCSGSGVCSAQGTCSCAPNFTGTSCESCATGFFGPTCSQSCPTGCPKGSCSDGLTGTGQCLVSITTNPSSTCNCLNGVCSGTSSCTCNAGFTTASNGTLCAACSPGFFQTSTGDCKACAVGCTTCASVTGTCTSCASGFTQNANDPTQCTPVSSTTSSGTVCPDGSFGNGASCVACSPECQTCNGATSSNCIICGAGKYRFGNSCVGVDANGVCQGTTGGMIADNNKHECDACGAKCTSCAISGFNVASTVSQLQCTGCLPGFVLSKGQCISSCPSGTFLSPTDNLTCTPCDSTCTACSGTSTFCLTCPSSLLASSGKCVTSCPSGTVSSGGSCLACHPDCATCSGPGFNQCSSCSSSTRPVLSSGRCLPTCNQSQFFATSSSSCQACDSSCSSCSGSGPSQCLACASSNDVLKSGTCVAAACSSSSSVVPSLGVCLSDLVHVTPVLASGTAPALPKITGLTDPTIVASGHPLAWWEILLMALGCAFIFMCVLMCWRRRARKQRALRTQQFAKAKALTPKADWRYRLVRFGEKLFGHKRSHLAGSGVRLKEAEEARSRIRRAHSQRSMMDMDELNLIDSYGFRTPRSENWDQEYYRNANSHHRITVNSDANSLFSTVTGEPRRGAEVRQPVRSNSSSTRSRRLAGEPGSRFSSSSLGSAYPPVQPQPKKLVRKLPPAPPSSHPSPTAAEEYVASITGDGAENYWIRPQETGSSAKSNNPFHAFTAL